MEWMTDPAALVGLLTLTALELVLGIDNIIFITILAGQLPRDQQPRARRLGLTVALVSRILFLLSIAAIMRLTTPLFPLFGHDITGRDLILIIGGLFLIGKATFEIHSKLEGAEDAHHAKKVASLAAVLTQIFLVDVIFSVDSVITAVGMVQQVSVMIIANVIALAVMLLAANAIGDFVERHPTVKVLALAFLVMIGGNLFIEGFGYHVPKGYTYFAMAFAIGVEMLNIRLRKKSTPVHLHGPEAPRV
ncbi:MAG TPA: TerC family protein [Gemmatimonadaceae bacterium]|nr:TerC family protein [Gemmatimonadaceae bacterium]